MPSTKTFCESQLSSVRGRYWPRSSSRIRLPVGASSCTREAPPGTLPTTMRSYWFVLPMPSTARGEAWIQGHAAIHEQGRTDHVVRLVGGQPHCRPGNVLGFANASIRHQGHQRLVCLGRIPCAGVDGRADGTRSNRVDTDPVWCHFLRQALHQLPDATL